LSREQLLALPNIGNAKADAILEAIKAADLPADVNAEPTTIRRNVVPIDSERKVPRHVALVTPDEGNSEEGDAA
jgi:endonuclease III